MKDDIVQAADGDVSDTSQIDEVSQTDEVTHVSKTDYNDKRCQLEKNDENDSDATNCSEDPDATNCSEVQHTITFKCIGTMHDFHAQSALCRVSQPMAKGEIVPVNIYPEPNNIYNSKAVSFKRWLDDNWHTIGYIVKEALDAVHEARDNDKIIGFFQLGQVFGDLD